MSPDITALQRAVGGFPRVSGDEPKQKDMHMLILTFSPRERG